MLTGDNGILTKAIEAKETNARKTAEEQVKIVIMGSCRQDGKIDLGELKDNLNKIPGIEGVPSGDITEFPFEVTVDGQKVAINKTGETVTAVAKAETTPSTSEEPVSPTYTAYSVGDTFTVNGETFYVIEASDTNTEKVKGLAAKNIDANSLKQSDDAGTIAFSSTNYWSSISNANDLNNEAVSTDTDAIAIAKAYGATIGNGAKGRLMTKEEVFALTGLSSKGIIINPSWLITTNYWLSSVKDNSTIWIMAGPGFWFMDSNGIYWEVKNALETLTYENNQGLGVRPVIEISKNNIS